MTANLRIRSLWPHVKEVRAELLSVSYGHGCMDGCQYGVWMWGSWLLSAASMCVLEFHQEFELVPVRVNYF